MNPYRQRIWATLRELLVPCGRLERVLDFGSGDGWFLQQMLSQGVAREVVGIDVQDRPAALVKPLLYDGQTLPFEDRSFDLVFSADVLHHCPRPQLQLQELLRTSKQYLLLKDHTYRDRLGWLALCGMDEIGNRKFGVPSRYQYQRGWEWLEWIEAAGFAPVSLIHPARCHRGVLGALTNSLQFIGLWKRIDVV